MDTIEKQLNMSGNQSVEALIGRYLDCEKRINVHKDQEDNKNPSDPERQRIIKFCQEKLQEAKSAIFPRTWPLKRRKLFLAWGLLHRIQEELILLMDPYDLIAFGTALKLDLKMSPMPETHQVEWHGKISTIMQQLEQAYQGGGAATSGNNGRAASSAGVAVIAARIFKNISKAVNDSVDDRFWDLWVQKVVSLLYAVLIIIGGLTFFPTFYLTICKDKVFCLESILLIGATGGLLSGILSGERETFPKSHFWVPITYYALVRPLIGAIAALVFFWVLQSEVFIKIDPPLQAANNNQLISSDVSKDSTSRQKETTVSPTAPDLTNDSQPFLTVSTMIFRSADNKQQYLFMILLLFAGFSGDKLLKNVADKVTLRLIAEAEKTRVAAK